MHRREAGEDQLDQYLMTHPTEVFSRTGRARLVLITCGGSFDSATGNYEDNIVAYAEPT